MLISKNWLMDYVDCRTLSAADFNELVTVKIAEVDHVTAAGVALESAVAVLVRSVTPHPAKSNLKVAVVSTGKGEATVVCGAPNCRAGMLTAYLPVGGRANSPHGALAVEAREFGGVVSNGVLLSEAELDVSADHSGIVELDATGLKPGDRVSALYGEPDTIIELDNKSLTHRPDLWSHFGFAREIAAVLGKPIVFSPDIWADDREEGRKLLEKLGSGPAKFRVEIDPRTKSRRFTVLEIANVTVQPSPLWMRRRLYSIGAGIRNLLVDLSNYVMHDIGQPNHAYDADLLQGDAIYVRFAQAGERFTALDGLERELTTEDVVIADRESAVAMGGVIGGAKSSIQPDTKRLLLESANFDAVSIRMATKRHQLRTDASNRFEKSQSAYQTPLAIQRFVQLLKQADSRAEVCGGAADCFIDRPKAVSVNVTFDYIRSRLGADVANDRITQILLSLGFKLRTAAEGKIAVDVPYYRATRDVSTPDDLVEEIGRIYGYSNIPEQAPLIASVPPPRSSYRNAELELREALRANGFSEVYNYSFMSKEHAERLGYVGAETMAVANPIDATLDVMRSSLVPNVLQVANENGKLRNKLALFELGRGFQTKFSPAHEALKSRELFKNPPAFERRLLCLAYASGEEERSSEKLCSPALAQGADFYAVLSLIKRLARMLSVEGLNLGALTALGTGQPADNHEVLRSWMHPYRAAALKAGGSVVGIIAEVRRGVLADIPQRLIVAEIDVELLLEQRRAVQTYVPLSRFPDSFFEMSVVLPECRPYAELETLLSSNVPEGLLRKIQVLTVYRGKPLDDGQKSISVKLFLGAPDRTLGGDELSAIQNRLIEVVRGSGFLLRG